MVSIYINPVNIALIRIKAHLMKTMPFYFTFAVGCWLNRHRDT